MSHNGYVQTLTAAQSDGTALANSSTPTTILPGQNVFTLPANLLEFVGMTFRYHAAGRISTVVTTPGTLTLDVRLGSVIVATSQAMALNTTAQTNQTWTLDWYLTLRAVGNGTSANFMHVGEWKSRAVVGSGAAGSAGVGMLLIPETAPAVGTGFDMTSAQAVNSFATWSIANAANSIQCHIATLELMN